MPPKKKTRVAARTSVHEEDSTVVDTPRKDAPEPIKNHNILEDPWTDEQETSLFKGIIRWKPAGWSRIRLLSVTC